MLGDGILSKTELRDIMKQTHSSLIVVCQRLKTSPALYIAVISVSVFPAGRHCSLSSARWSSPYPHMLHIAYLRQQYHNSKFMIFSWETFKDFEVL